MPDALARESQSFRPGASGKWVVVAIFLLGAVLAILAIKFRIDPSRKPTTVPSTLPIAQDGMKLIQ